MNNKLTAGQKKEIDHKIMQGAVHRASTLSLFYAAAFTIFGFTSFEVLNRFDSSLQLWSNVWPRIVFNCLPFLAFHFFFKKFKHRTHIKLWLWTVGLPVIFVAACCIHVWPIILQGHPDLYLYFHATNSLIIVMSLLTVAPPPRFVAASIGLFAFLFMAPLTWILLHLQQPSLLKFIINDFAYAIFLGGLSAHMSFKLRQALAFEDVMKKQKIGKFIGQIVSESIFEQNDSLLKPRTANAFLLSIDVRGFTSLMKNHKSGEASLFKEKYHQLVAKVVGDMGGFIHKTHGDGHLISIGLMSKEVDLSDVPGIQQDLKKVEMKRREQQLARAIVIFEKIFGQFEQLKANMSIEDNACVCASIDFGEIGLKVLGDPNVRLEFDLEGLVVIRCSRLEAYTKTLREVFTSDNSFLILSSAAAQHLSPDVPFQIFTTKNHIVKDFPDESFISYKEYKRRRSSRSAA